MKTTKSGVHPDTRKGRQNGRKQRNKDQSIGVYPRPGLPIGREGKSDRYLKGYQSAYYQPKANGGQMLGDEPRAKIQVSVDRSVLDLVLAKGVKQSHAAELGLRIIADGLDQRLVEAWGNRISGVIDNSDGTWSIVHGQKHHTAVTIFEAIVLMLCDQSTDR